MLISDVKRIDFHQQREVRRVIRSNDWLYDGSTIKDYDRAVYLIHDVSLWNIHNQKRKESRDNQRTKNRSNRSSWNENLTHNQFNSFTDSKKSTFEHKKTNGEGKLTCYHCREEGHKKTNCSQLAKGNNRSVSNNSIVISANGIGTINNKRKIKFHNPSPEEWKKINSAYPAVSNLIYTEVDIKDIDDEKHNFLGIIDNGSQATIIREKIVQLLKLDTLIRRSNFSIKGFFSNEPLTVKEEITLELSTGNDDVVTTNAMIIDDARMDPNLDIILGVTLKDYVKELVEYTSLKECGNNKSKVIKCCKIMSQCVNSKEVVIDLRNLNEITIPISFNCESIDDIVHKTYDSVNDTSQLFSSIDLSQSFYQFAIPENKRKLFGLRFMGRVLTLLRLPQGYKNSPALLTDILRKAFLDFTATGSRLNWYINNSLLSSRTYEEQIVALIILLKKLQELNLKVNIRKSFLGSESVKMRGHELHGYNNFVTPSKEAKKLISSWKIPTDCCNVKKFLGLLGYYLKYLPDQTRLLKPLRELVRISKVEEKNGNKNYFEFNDECLQSFNNVKKLFEHTALFNEISGKIEDYENHLSSFYCELKAVF
uniref:CCHC-type domain-containing protein n=1 Tax=Strongyloides stercoralis TaxID=6248 RepID=A0AAF5DQY4_STRER